MEQNGSSYRWDQRRFGQVKIENVEHVKRAANSTAYILARETFSCVIDRVWVEKISHCIYVIVTKE